MNAIVYWDQTKTTLFAVAELKRLLHNVQVATTVHKGKVGIDYPEAIHLITTDAYNQITTKKKQRIAYDGFAIIQAEATWIIGNEPRAILYGIYAYCRQQYGYEFTALEKETVDVTTMKQPTQTFIHEPMFKRRGNVLETINDPDYINSLVDWGIKNGQNEYFFTFFLWDEMKPYIYETLQTRSAQVTLGGHSLSYLLQKIQSEATEAELAQDEKLRFFAENEALQAKVIEEIVHVCQANPIVARISLWPEDIGIDEKDAVDFLETYIMFTEKLKKALYAAGLPVEAEHIVYNAGLSWDMLEKEKTGVSNEIDVLYAYWGRDYSKSIHADTSKQKRALHTLNDWKQATTQAYRELTIFEYYSDHFMLTELFPPLLSRINEDLLDYKQLNINGIVNLIVPLHKKGIHPEIDNHYPWQWIHHMNNYLFMRLAWGIDYEEALEEYFNTFKKDKTAFLEKMQQLETIIAPHTKWNSILFPARIVDPEKVSETDEYPEVLAYLEETSAYLNSFDVTEIEHLLAVQTAKNSASFTTREMTLIYFYYLKQLIGLLNETWR